MERELDHRVVPSHTDSGSVAGGNDMVGARRGGSYVMGGVMDARPFSSTGAEAPARRNQTTGLRGTWRKAVSGLMAIAAVFTAVIAVETVGSPAAAATNHLSNANVHVVSATDAAPITTFKYIINLDNTGTTEQRTPADGCSPEDPGYPASCHWTSMGTASSSPVVTQGTEADFAAGFDLPHACAILPAAFDHPLNLPSLSHF